MITAVLLILSLYVTLFATWWQLWHVIKMMTDVKNILNDDEFFGDAADTPKDSVQQHNKWECFRPLETEGAGGKGGL